MEEQNLIATRNSGCNWFFWIAGLTALNTIIMMTVLSGTRLMTLGLGVTWLVDAYGDLVISRRPTLTTMVNGFAFLFSVLTIAITILWGVLGRKGHHWAILVGGVLYVLDTLLIFYLGSQATRGPGFFSIIFHLWAIVAIFAAWNAGLKLDRLRKSAVG